MAQIRGTAGYHLGNNQNNNTNFNSNNFNSNSGMGMGMGNSSRQEATNDPSPLAAIRAQTSKIEDWLDTYATPSSRTCRRLGGF